MFNFLKKNFSLISFVFIPIFFLWHPNWIGILGIQPYWPLFWLLPWSMLHGPINGLIAGLFLGLALDSITASSGFSQIPGLIICGFSFGRIKNSSNFLVDHFRNGLLCSLGSLGCSSIIILQIVVKNFSSNNLLLVYPGVKNLLAQVFLTGIFAPLICSKLFVLFKTRRKSF